jgi:hypothetical protein
MKTETKNLAQTGKTNAVSIDCEMPNLQIMSASRLDLNTNYWTPATVLEVKLGMVLGLENSEYLDQKTGEMIPLKCVIFVEQLPDLSLIRWRNGACKLVATIENVLNNGTILPGRTPVRLEYLGKSKTKNGNFTDNFSVKLLTAVNVMESGHDSSEL